MTYLDLKNQLVDLSKSYNEKLTEIPLHYFDELLIILIMLLIAVPIIVLTIIIYEKLVKKSNTNKTKKSQNIIMPLSGILIFFLISAEITLYKNYSVRLELYNTTLEEVKPVYDAYLNNPETLTYEIVYLNKEPYDSSLNYLDNEGKLESLYFRTSSIIFTDVDKPTVEIQLVKDKEEFLEEFNFPYYIVNKLNFKEKEETFKVLLPKSMTEFYTDSAIYRKK